MKDDPLHCTSQGKTDVKELSAPMGVNLAGPGQVRAPWVQHGASSWLCLRGQSPCTRQRRAPKRDPTAALGAFSRKALGAAFFSSLAASGANPVCGAVLFVFWRKAGVAAHC